MWFLPVHGTAARLQLLKRYYGGARCKERKECQGGSTTEEKYSRCKCDHDSDHTTKGLSLSFLLCYKTCNNRILAIRFLFFLLLLLSLSCCLHVGADAL